MAQDQNLFLATGRLGQDPKAAALPSGDPVSEFSIAVGESWKDKQGQKQERTEWVNCKAFRGLAGVCNQYLQKGSFVRIAGKLTTQTWEKDGQKHYKTEIVLSDMQMLDSKGGNSAPEYSGKPEAKQPAPQSNAGESNDFDDDCPF